MSPSFRDYIRDLQVNLERGDATEHTHRPALKSLLESVANGVAATNEPKRIECGAPDFSVSKGEYQSRITLGYVEAKDLGTSLDAIDRDSRRTKPATPNGNQLKRYREALPNLILTDYTEFRWYTEGSSASARVSF